MNLAPEGRAHGLLYILAATAIAGAIGYLIQLLAPALLADAPAYVSFSAFWSALHLCLAAISGVQQEVTRATSISASNDVYKGLRRLALSSLIILSVVTILLGLFLAPRVFAVDPIAMTIWFGVGVAGNLFMAILGGVMYGASLWRAIAGMTVIDASIRGALVVAGLLLGFPPGVLAAFIAVPFALAVGVMWLIVRKSIVGRVQLDVQGRRLATQTIRAVVAAGATGVMITGLPLFIGFAMPNEPAVTLASLILVITITRAPLIIPLIALQSFLIIEFRQAGHSLRRRMLKYLAILAAVSALAAASAVFWGPPVIDFVSGARYEVSPWVAFSVVLSAGLVAGMCLTGPALLSGGRHTVYAGGWLAAAIATILILFIPVEPTVRTMAALLAAPVLGLVIHLVGLETRGRLTSRP